MKMAENSIIAAIATICLVCGCSRTVTSSDGSAVTVSGDGTKISLKSADGATTVNGSSSQQYPADFPVAQYPGSKISTNMTINSTATNSQAATGQKMIMLTTPDKSTPIVQFYKDKLTAAGWTIENSMDTPGAASFVGATKDKAKLYVSIIAGTSDTVISISLQ